MNKVILRTKNHISIQKSKYLFLLSIIIIGIISGIFFIIFITKEDKLLIKNNLNLISNTINNHKINYLRTLLNSLSNNLLSILGIYILGISIIGIPLIILFLYFKGFIFGFSISSFMYTYKINGLYKSFIYLFPHRIISLIIFILLGFHCINFSTRLFRYLFLKENIKLNIYFKKLNKILFISIITVIISSLFETFITPLIFAFFS